jgi:hypothetical protein
MAKNYTSYTFKNFIGDGLIIRGIWVIGVRGLWVICIIKNFIGDGLIIRGIWVIGVRGLYMHKGLKLLGF